MKNTTSHKKRGLFDEHSSYVKHTLIPLLGFSGYHQTVSEEEGDAKFVGRKPIIDRLGLWLADLKSANGAYLITGYRGMGKSSLVGQVLYKLTGGASSIRYKILFWVVYLCVVACSGMFVCCDMPVGTVMGWLLLSIAASLLFIVWFLRDKSAEKRHFLIIKLNVGRETLGNREILHLIVKNAYDKFNEFAHDYECNLSYHIVSLFIKIVVTTLLFRCLDFPTFPSKNEYLAWFIDIFRLTGEKIGETGALIYFLVLYLLVYLLGQRLLAVFSRLIPFPFQTCYMLSQRLYRLHERSIATVSDDLASINRHIVLSLFRRKQYQPPTVHEMEQELISVFADMEKLLMRRPRFIIVLDELDKVEPSADDSEKDVIPEFNPSAVGGIGGKNSPVNRQRELLRMLSDMKYFMSTVRAKFIFIAGRELYDAYLKDVSDREYSVSSIFNGVINVNSFLKSGDSQGDITSMTEALLCSRLMKGSGRTLAVYYKEEKARIADSKNREVQQKRLDRNIVLLYQFILYLVHISNGSPKKIAIYLEQYIRSREYLQDIKHLTLEESPAECGYYLSFGCKDIQKIGFVHYLVYPVTQVMVNKSRVYGDKLLLSTSFIINQIYKYHNTGFSWRNLEHIPELLEINKMPELRDFIGGIVSFLRKTHLTRILSGLYLFKFPMKISEEISFMSKQSEDLSALFNFSQDESRSIRRH